MIQYSSMLPCTMPARRQEPRAGVGADDSTVLDQDSRYSDTYDTDDADADSNTAQGSAEGLTGAARARMVAQGCTHSSQTPSLASRLATPPSRTAAQQYAAHSMGHAQEPHDAADTPPQDSAASVIMEHTATPAGGRRGARHHARFTDAGVKSALLERRRDQKAEEIGGHRMHATHLHI